MDQVPEEAPQSQLPEKQEQHQLFEALAQMLQQKQQQVVRDFRKKHKQFAQWLDDNQHNLAQVQGGLVKFMLASGLTATMMVSAVLPTSSPSVPSPPASPTPSASASPAPTPPATTTIDPTQDPLAGRTLSDLMQMYNQWPSEQVENEISARLSSVTKVPSVATLDDHKMNKIMGLMGAEQHLYRYPGDTLEDHFKNAADRALYFASGIAPGLGAWGYFAPSKAQFTDTDAAREKYYIAAQTFLFPGYYSDRNYRDWLKYRKVLVYNPENGKAVVADIGDSGPATWTGKTYGGAPAVMQALGLYGGPRKGEVIVLFVNDPNDTVPLGPVANPSAVPTVSPST